MPLHVSSSGMVFRKIPEINPSPREWNDPYEYIQNLHKWYGSDFGCVKVIPPACWSPTNAPWKKDAPRFRPKVQNLSLLNGENRQEVAFTARIRVSSFLAGYPLPRCDPVIETRSGQRVVVKIRKLTSLLESCGIDIHSPIDAHNRSIICGAIRTCVNVSVSIVQADSIIDQVISLLNTWGGPKQHCDSFKHLSTVPPPLLPRDRVNCGEFWTYTPRDDQVYRTRFLNNATVKKPAAHNGGLPYVEISVRNPATGLSCISRMDEEDIDMYLANGHSPESARAATKCLLCEVCLVACGFPVDPEDLVIPECKRPIPPATREELQFLQSQNPAVLCSGCGITVHVECLGKNRPFVDQATLHYIAKTDSDWFCANCVPPGFPRNAAHATQFGYQFTDHEMTRKEYEKRSDQKRAEIGISPKARLEEIESKFWALCRTNTDIQVLYASDLDSGDFSDGSFAEKFTNPTWDLRKLSLSSESVLRHLPGAESITGVSRPWLYLGSFFSSFCWHSEDHFLCSISYLHEGAPKVWYTIPGQYRGKMDEVMATLLPDLYTANRDLSHHLVTLIDPEILVKSFGIPVGRIVQNPGEFIITFPEAFHCGFNAGVNLAEAVNVACPDWFMEHGKKSVDHYAAMRRPSVFCFDALVWETARAILKGQEMRKTVGEYCVEFLRNVMERLGNLEVESGMKMEEEIGTCEECQQFCYFASTRGRHCIDCGSGEKVVLRHSIEEIETLVEKVSSRIAQYRSVRRSSRAAGAASLKRTRTTEL